MKFILQILIFCCLNVTLQTNGEAEITFNGKTLIMKTAEEDTDNVIPDDEDVKKKNEEMKPKMSSKEMYANLKTKLASIRKSCGEVCDTSMDGIPGKYYNSISKKINCQSLFTNPNIDSPSDFTYPLKAVPKYLIPDFTYNGKLKIINFHRDDSDGVSHYTEWTMELFRELKKRYDEKRLNGPYGQKVVDEIDSYFGQHVQVKDKRVLVIGSQTPWIETILLAKGAKFITTFDYVKINSHHPQVEVLTPEELSFNYLDDNILYDVMVTFSSLEHSGLGRYGDMLNPWGDLIAMARAWCLVKPGGYAMVGVPSGPDVIIFNSHRLYGPISYSHLFANWKQDFTDNDFNEFNKTGCDFCYQPLHVLQRL